MVTVKAELGYGESRMNYNVSGDSSIKHVLYKKTQEQGEQEQRLTVIFVDGQRLNAVRRGEDDELSLTSGNVGNTLVKPGDALLKRLEGVIVSGLPEEATELLDLISL